MARASPTFVCGSCGGETLKWQGQCPLCGAWNSLEQRSTASARPASTASAVSLSAGVTLAAAATRLASGAQELDRVLGGGIVPGSVVLLGGDPGIGKSTLLLIVSSLLCEQGPVLYVSGEESPEQLKMRADRLGLTVDRLFVLAETQVESILNQVAELRPTCVVVDSIQTMALDGLESPAGSVSQVRECAMAFQRY